MDPESSTTGCRSFSRMLVKAALWSMPWLSAWHVNGVANAEAFHSHEDSEGYGSERLVNFLEQDKSPNEAQRLIEQLRSEDPEARGKAAQELVRMGEKALLELEKAAGDEDAEVATRVKELLGHIPKPTRYRIHLARIDKSSGPARYNLGEYCLSIELYQKGVAEFQTAAQLDPKMREKWKQFRPYLAQTLYSTAHSHLKNARYKVSRNICGLLLQEFSDTLPAQKTKALKSDVDKAIAERDEKAAKDLYKSAWEAYHITKDEADGLKKFRQCLSQYSHTEYLGGATPSNQTRIQIIKRFLKGLNKK